MTSIPKGHCYWDIESMRKQFEPPHYATNRLIAKFVGLMPETSNQIIWYDPDRAFFGVGCSHTKDLKFHSSWEWLMVVYQKICKLPSTGDRSHPPSGPLGIFSNIKYQIPDLEKSYFAIVEFIKYYNSHGERTNG